MKKWYWIALVCLLAASTSLFADSVVEEIVARVNSDIITRSDFQRGKEQLLADLKQQFGDKADQQFQANEKNVLRDLIDQQLLLQKGKDLGINVDADVIKRLDEIRKQLNLESMDDLEKAAQQQCVSFEDFKQNIRNGIMTQKVIQQEVGSKIQISKEDETKFYEEHKKELEQPEQVRLNEILVAIKEPDADTQKANPNASAEAVAAAEAKANQLLDQIHKGAAFEDVAKKSSDGPSAAQGGDLGLFKRGMLAKELEDLTFGMKPGSVSNVIRTKQGFVILKVAEHQQAGIPSMKEVEPRLQDAIYMEKLQPAVREYLTKLREEAYIDIKDGYADTGASPNETKPIITTASADDAGKKPKKKKKLLIF